MIQIRDITWAAGLLDGEGCFTLAKKQKYGYPFVCCNMTDREPLERLQKLFGGTIYEKTRQNHWKLLYRWEVGNARAVGVMMTLYSELCPRRQTRIREVLEHWKSRVAYQKDTCRNGHTYTPETTTYAYKVRKGVKRKYRLCRTCLELKGDKRAKAKGYDEVPDAI